MDLTSFPDYIIFKILGYLRFEERVRIGRVNSYFYYKSGQLASRIKKIDFKREAYQLDSAEGFEILLSLCHNRLEKITFQEDGDRTIVDVLSQFSCPRLTEVDLANTRVSNETFHSLLKNAVNLRSLTWNVNRKEVSLVFPCETVNGNFEWLDVTNCNDSVLRVLMWYCPNLSKLKLLNPNSSFQSLDDFIANVPNLRVLMICLPYRNPLGLGSLVNSVAFWNLRQLRVLIMQQWVADYDSGNAFLQRVSATFHRLETLLLTRLRLNSLQAIWALSSLRYLRHLILRVERWGDGDLQENAYDIDFAVRYLTKCNHLQSLEISCAISPVTLLEFIRRCPQLNAIHVDDILNTSSEDEKIAVAKSIGQYCRRNFALRLPYPYSEEAPESLWTSSAIKDVLNGIRDERGFTVQIDYGNSDWSFSDF